MLENRFDLEKQIEREYRRTRLICAVVVLIVPIVILLSLYIINSTLPGGIQFRTNFFVVTCVVCFLTIFFDLIILAVLVHHMIQTGWKRVLVTVISVIVIIVYIIGGSFAMLLTVLDHDNEKMLEDGRILVTENHFLDENTYYIAEPYRIIFRKYLYAADYQGNVYNREEIESDNVAGQEEIDSNNQWIADLYEKIYVQALAASDGAGDGLVYGMTAKGELIAYVGDLYSKEIQGEIVDAQLRMVYDRKSKNGLAYLVVLYEDHYDADGNRLDNTSIINFYAVKDDEVIAADKTSWEEVGSPAYREATGE